MIYYISTFFFSVLTLFFAVNVKNKIQKKILVFFSMIPLILVMGFRSELVGTDSLTYSYIYDNSSNFSNLFIYNSGVEYGYLFYSYLLHFLGLSNYGYLFIFNAIIVIFLLYDSFKLTRNKVLALSLFFGMANFYFLNFNVMRQGMAVIIFCYSLKYLFDSRYFIYFLLSLLAFSIHYTAVLMFLFPFLLVERNGNFYIKIKMLFILIFCLFYTFFINVVYAIYGSINNNKAELYVGKVQEVSINSFLVYFSLFIFFVVVYFNIPLNKLDNRIRFFMCLFWGLIVFYFCIIFLGLKYEGPGRVVLYFFPAIFLGLPIALEKINISVNSRRVILSFFVFLNFIYIYIAYTYIGNAHEVLPYKINEIFNLDIL